MFVKVIFKQIALACVIQKVYNFTAANTGALLAFLSCFDIGELLALAKLAFPFCLKGKVALSNTLCLPCWMKSAAHAVCFLSVLSMLEFKTSSSCRDLGRCRVYAAVRKLSNMSSCSWVRLV